VRIALGSDADPDQSAHLDRCERCRTGLESLGSLVRELGHAYARFDRGHEEARTRLLAALPAARPQPAPARRWSRFFHPIGGLTMRQRLTLGTAGATLVIAACVAWLATVGKPIYGMDTLPEAIRNAKSYEYAMVIEVDLPGVPGRAAARAEMKGHFYWSAPGSYRIETQGGTGTIQQDVVLILPAGKPGIEIDRKLKKFVRQPARLGQVSDLMALDKLSTFSGHADRDLGVKEIGGRKAKGFEIQARKIDPDTYSGPMQIWIDAETNLPCLVTYEIKGAPDPGKIRMTDFRWNQELDPKLFDPTPPGGFEEVARKASPLDEQVRKITESMKLYAKYSGGHYPRVKMLYGDVTRDEFAKLCGAPFPPRTKDDYADPRVAMVHEATWGFSYINVILRENPDAAYHGKTVGPDDKDKVLLRWKLEDGTYEVIYGDLRSEAVPAGRLKTLEGQ
jgi:outer membrane lipoprotein-sorting protein